VSRVPGAVWAWLEEVLYDVSDECDRVHRGPYMLCYEGWGGFCVGDVWDNSRTTDENEEACYAYAEEMAGTVIAEWEDEYSQTHELVEAGHKPTGLYGVTWALFRLKNPKDNRARTGLC
jgi:hypothetical protein